MLTVEDGSKVPNADSYISLAEARAYAASRGLQISSDDVVAEQQLRQGYDWIERQGYRFKGVKVESNQSSQWPRLGAYRDGYMLDTTIVPAEIRYAQVHVAVAVHSGTNLYGVTEKFIKKEVVGPIETEYSEKIGISTVPTVTAAENLLSGLFATTPGNVTVERV